MITWCYLSIGPRVKSLADKIPNLIAGYADIDGVIVLPEYRGNGIQVLMFEL